MKIIFTLFILMYSLPPVPILGFRFNFNYLLPLPLALLLFFKSKYKISRESLYSSSILPLIFLGLVSISAVNLDISESIRYAYIPFAYIVFSLVGRNSIMKILSSQLFLFSTFFLSYFVLFLSLFQYFSSAASRSISSFYGASAQIISSLSIYNRITSVCSNPSDSALFALSFIVLAIFCYVSNAWSAKQAVFRIFPLSIIFFLSQSRTLMMGSALFPVLLFFFNIKTIKKNIVHILSRFASLKVPFVTLLLLFASALIIAILAFLPYVKNSSNIFNLVSLASSILSSNHSYSGEANSASVRIFYFLGAFGFQAFQNEAPAKVLDSEFLKISTLSSYFLLFAVYIPLLLLVFTRLLKSMTTNQVPKYLIASSFCFYVVIVASFSNFVFSNLLLSPLIALNVFLFSPPSLVCLKT